MSKRQLENESKCNSENNPKIPDYNLQKPKAVSNAKVDRLGSKTAPIEADFVNIYMFLIILT